jgi:quercetin dioxygenase-like cupin family protein
VQTWDLTAIDTPGGTVSPVVLHSDEARAVLIGVEPGQELGDHQVTERAWVVVVDGEVELESGAGGAVLAGPGTLATFAPGERHALRSAEGARVLLVLAPWPGEGHYRGGGLRAAEPAPDEPA